MVCAPHTRIASQVPVGRKSYTPRRRTRGDFRLLNDLLRPHPDAVPEERGRAGFSERRQFRFAAPVRSVAELKKRLTAWLRTVGEDASSVQRTSAAPIAFIFPGQGSQHAGMAAKLYRAHSVFRNAMDRCHALAERGGPAERRLAGRAGLLDG